MKKKTIFILLANLKALKTECIIEITISNKEDYDIVIKIFV